MPPYFADTIAADAADVIAERFTFRCFCSSIFDVYILRFTPMSQCHRRRGIKSAVHAVTLAIRYAAHLLMLIHVARTRHTPLTAALYVGTRRYHNTVTIISQKASATISRRHDYDAAAAGRR